MGIRVLKTSVRCPCDSDAAWERESESTFWTADVLFRRPWTLLMALTISGPRCRKESIPRIRAVMSLEIETTRDRFGALLDQPVSLDRLIEQISSPKIFFYHVFALEKPGGHGCCHSRGLTLIVKN